MDSLKRRLEYHYKAFDKSQISPDPLEFPHNFSEPLDIEISAFISSIFAYGNVIQIKNTLESIHSLMNNKPYEYVVDFDIVKERINFRLLKHRFYTGDDIAALFYILHRVYENYGSLRNLFSLYYFEKEKNLKNSISFLSKNLISLCEKKCELTNGLRFMFPDPFNGSACKRMNLFLRWMIRNDHLDFGIWREIPTGKLIIPVDTHIARICKQLKLTKRKVVSWKMAEEITENLKRYDPLDPVKYDFALCHLGIRKMKL